MKKISVLLEDEAFELFESYCETRGYKKSTLVAKLIRDHLADKDFFLKPSLSLSHHPVERPHLHAHPETDTNAKNRSSD